MKNNLFRSVLTIACITVSFFSVNGQTYDYYNNLAKQEFDNKNYQKAIEYCNQSINLQANGWAYWERAAAKANLKNYNGSVDDYTLALSYYSNADKASIYYSRGYNYIDLREYQKAIEDFNQALSNNHEKPADVYWERAVAYDKLGLFQKAIDDYTSAISRISNQKDLSVLYNKRGYARVKLGKLDEAIADLNQSIQYDAAYGTAYWNRSLYWEKKFEYQKASDDVSKAIDIYKTKDNAKSDLAILHRNRGYYKYLLGNYQAALADEELAQTYNPSYSSLYWDKGLIYESLEQYDRAVENYSNAINLEEDKIDQASLYRNRSLSYRNLLQYGKAMQDINKAISLNPEYRDAYRNRAVLHEYKKQYAEAIKDYDKAIELFAGNNFTLADIYLDRGWAKAKLNSQDAVGDFKKAVELDGENDDVHYEAGRFFKTKLKNNSLAEIHLDKASSLALRYNDDTYALSKSIQGKKDVAVTFLEQQIEKESTDKYRHKWNLHVMACIYALNGDTNKALEFVEKSFTAGFKDYDHLVNDRDLESLVALPQYKAILLKNKVPQPKW